MWHNHNHGEYYSYEGLLPPHTFIEVWRMGKTDAGHPVYGVRIENYGTGQWLSKTSSCNRSTPKSTWRLAAAQDHAERWIQEHVTRTS